MEFESEYVEKQLDYLGAGGFIDGEGIRRKREKVEEEVIKLADEELQDNKILIIKGDDEMTNRSEFLQESIEAFLEQAVEPDRDK